MARKNVHRLDKCIYRDASGIEAVVAMKGLTPRRERFALAVWETPAGRDRVRARVKTLRAEMAAELAAFGVVVKPVRGTLRATIAEWETRLHVRKGAASDKSHAYAWLAVTLPGDSRPLGDWQLAEIKPKHVDQTIQIWQTTTTPGAKRLTPVRGHTRRQRGGEGLRSRNRPRSNKPLVGDYVRRVAVTSGDAVAHRTIRHRCRVLRDVLRMAAATPDNVKPWTAVDGARVPKTPPPTIPQTIPADVIDTMLAKLPAIDPLSFVRFAVFVTTMQRPAQIMAATRAHIDLKAKTWTVQSAKGAPPHTIDLSDDAVDAWKLFIAANAWGPFDQSQYGDHCHQAGLPDGIRPYAARHTGAQLALASGVSMEKLSPQMGHTSTQTTKRFYTGFVRDPEREVASALDGRFGGRFKAQPRLVKKSS